MKLELMNEEEQGVAMRKIEIGFDMSLAEIYALLRQLADKQGFCCVSYMLESEG